MIMIQKIQSFPVLLWLVLASVTLAAYDDGPLSYPLLDLCRRWDHQTAVLGDKLYLVGGRVLTKGTLKSGFGNMSSTWEGEPSSEFLSLDLTVPFGLEKTEDNDGGRALPRWAPVPYKAGDNLNMTEALAVANAGMWTANNKLYLYEGQRIKGARDTDPSTLLSYDVSTSTWKLEKSWINPDGRLPNRFARGTSVDVPQIGMGFYVGGLRMYLGDDGKKEWEYPADQQLVGMDIGNGNYEVKYQKIMDVIRKTTGAAVTWIPVGEKGALAMIGGTHESDAQRETDADGDISPMSSIVKNEVIYLYDIAKDKWHVQNSHGSPPAARMHACAVTATAPDNKSHQIFYYGGGTGTRLFGQDDLKYMGDLYVLNLPTFEWQKFTDIEGAPPPRARHTCHVVNKRQFMIVGGGRNDTDTVQSNWCRWDEISVLDMSDLRWEKTYTPATQPYEVNQEVFKNSLVEGVPMTGPSLGWSNDGVKELFLSTVSSNSNPATTTALEQKAQGLPKGALVGIIVGAIAAVLFAIAGFVFWRRRRDAKLRKELGFDASNTSGSPESAYDKKGPLSPGYSGGEFYNTNKKSRLSELSDGAAISEMSAEPRPPAEMPAESIVYELPTNERSLTYADLHGGGSQSPNPPPSRPVSDLSSIDPAQIGAHLRAMSPVSPETVLEEITFVSSGPGASSSPLPHHEAMHDATSNTPPPA